MSLGFVTLTESRGLQRNWRDWLEGTLCVNVKPEYERVTGQQRRGEFALSAIAMALAAVRVHDWVGDIGKGRTTVTVKVRIAR
jgi:hypothetical protein